MRFLVDECTGPRVSSWLAQQGYEVHCIYGEARGASDDEILKKAYTENWILVTNDKDFGELIYRTRRLHHGIIFLRLTDERSKAKIEAMRLLLEQYADRLSDAFVVVTESHVRFGKLSTNAPPATEN